MDVLLDETQTDEISSEEELLAESSRPELLVPITLDIEMQGSETSPGFRLKDRFLWNVNEPFVTPRVFAQSLANDLGLQHAWIETITNHIISQVEDAQAVLEIDIADPPTGEDEVVWHDEDEEEGVDKVRDAGKDQGVEEDDGGDRERDEDEGEVWKEADQRVIVNVSADVNPSVMMIFETKASSICSRPLQAWWNENIKACADPTSQLEVQIYRHILRDRIEWDLSSSLPPSDFASSYVRDLGLSGEATPLIAHAITEELLKHKKDALDWRLFRKTHPSEQAKWEHPTGAARPKVFVKNGSAKDGAEGLRGVWRDWWEREEYGPVLVELGYDELERREAERFREARRVNRGVTGKRRRL